MPHLCPLNWSAALISFWLILLLLYTSIWWIQLPIFPPLHLSYPHSIAPTWPWK